MALNEKARDDSGDDDGGDETTLRDLILSHREMLATGLEQASTLKRAASDMVSGSKVRIPPKYLDDPQFAEIVRLFKLQQKMALSAAEFAESTVKMLDGWLRISTDVVDAVASYVP